MRAVPWPPKSFREPLWDAEKTANTLITIPYAPSELQLQVHLDPTRFKVVAGGEGSGKSRLGAREITDWCFWPLPESVSARTKEGFAALFWLIGPDYELTLPEFDYISDSLTTIGAVADGPHRYRRDSSYLVTKLGTRIETKTAADARKIAAQPPNGILICEVAQVSYEVFMRCLGRVSRTRGWVMGTGTFETSLGWLPELFQEWQGPNVFGGKSFSIPSWENRHVYPLGRQDPEILRMERSFTPERFAERIGAVPAPPSTTVFPEFRTIVHVPGYVEYKRELPVYLGVDPGYAGAYAVLAMQNHGDSSWAIDEVYFQGKSGKEIIEICKQKPWWTEVEHVYMDVAGRQHHADHSQEEIWARYAGIRPSTKRMRIQDEIDLYHQYLGLDDSGHPRLVFSENCQNTIREHFLYQYPTDVENRPRSEIPRDNNNHGIKALTYFLAGYKGYTARAERRLQPLPKIASELFA